MHAPRYSIPALALTWVIAAGGAGDPLSDCRRIADDAARLACYDALADQPPAARVPEVAAAAAAAPALSPEEAFGRTFTDERLKELTATVTGIQVGQSGKLVLALDNGQIWSQIDTETLRIKAGDAIRIRRAALSSYLLGHADGGRVIRVRRTQ